MPDNGVRPSRQSAGPVAPVSCGKGLSAALHVRWEPVVLLLQPDRGGADAAVVQQ